jgi:hypothetical protein
MAPNSVYLNFKVGVMFKFKDGGNFKYDGKFKYKDGGNYKMEVF